MIEQFDRSELPPITALGDALRAQPMAWRDIPEEYRKALEFDLMPYTVTDPAKVGWVRQWWLACTALEVDAINAALPQCVRVSARQIIGGGFALSCDLLSDSKPGQTYAAARDILEGLVLTFEPEFVPPPEPTLL